MRLLQTNITFWDYDSSNKPAVIWPRIVFTIAALTGTTPLLVFVLRIGILYDLLPHNLRPRHVNRSGYMSEFVSKEAALCRINNLLARVEWMESTTEAVPMFLLQGYVWFSKNQIYSLNFVQATSIASSFLSIFKATVTGKAVKYQDSKNDRFFDIMGANSDADDAWWQTYNLSVFLSTPIIFVDVTASSLSLVALVLYLHASFFYMLPVLLLLPVYLAEACLVLYLLYWHKKRNTPNLGQILRRVILVFLPAGVALVIYGALVPGQYLLDYTGPMFLGGQGLKLGFSQVNSTLMAIRFGSLNIRTIPAHLPFRLTYMAICYYIVHEYVYVGSVAVGGAILGNDIGMLRDILLVAIPASAACSIIASFEPLMPCCDSLYHRTIWCSRWSEDVSRAWCFIDEYVVCNHVPPGHSL